MSNVHRLSTAVGGDAATEVVAPTGAGVDGLVATGSPVSPYATGLDGSVGGSDPAGDAGRMRVAGEAEGSLAGTNSQIIPQASASGGVHGGISGAAGRAAGRMIVGAVRGANPHTPDGLPATPAWVQVLLEEAGATLLALPHTGYTTRLRQGGLEWVRDAVALAPGSGDGRVRPAAPSGAMIDRMDQVLAWVSLIPDGKQVLRRVVGARALVHPLTGRHLFAWRRLGTALGADHKAVQRWHAQGLDIITRALNAPLGRMRGEGGRAAGLQALSRLAQPGAQMTVGGARLHKPA